MKMIEIQLRSTTTELEKLFGRRERAEKKLAKTIEKVEKLECRWTIEEHAEWMDTVETVNGWMTNKKEIEKNAAWLDWYGAERELKDIDARIEKINARFEKQQTEVEEYREQVRKIDDAKRREELQKIDFETEKKEWAKDGINLMGRYWGETPQGNRFYIEKNNGWTERSLHCFTLRVACETIFTSGEFWRCYMEVKRR